VERGTFRAAGIVVSSDARHALGPDSRVRTFAGCPRVHAGSVRTVGPVHAGIYGRLCGPFADAQTAYPGCGRGAGDLLQEQAVCEGLQVLVWEAGAGLPRPLLLAGRRVGRPAQCAVHR
jgi:hypothetical protein